MAVNRARHPSEQMLFVDLLGKVRLKSGREEWLFLHVVIYNRKDENLWCGCFGMSLEQRDGLKGEVLNLVLLSEEHYAWRSSPCLDALSDCSVTVNFWGSKRRDLGQDLEESQPSKDPIELFIEAYLGEAAERASSSRPWREQGGLAAKP